MKKLLFKIISLFTYLIPTNLLIKLSGKKVIYPFYHIISDDPPAHIKYLYPIKSIKQFEKDLDFFQKHFSASKFPCDSKKTCFVLSFDDGLSEVFNTIAPILQKRKIPAIFFINSGFVDNKDLFYKYKISLIIEKLNKADSLENNSYLLNCKNKKECSKKIKSLSLKELEQINKIAEKLNINFKDYLKKNSIYLTSRQIKELIKHGFQIGAHSINHPLFSEINEEEQIRQVKECINYLQSEFIISQKLFAFPFSDDKVKDRFFKTIFDQKIADYTFGTAGIKEDKIKNNIQRIPVEKYGLSAKKHIKTEFLLYILKRIFNKHFVKRYKV